jgi:hypothetical protein
MTTLKPLRTEALQALHFPLIKTSKIRIGS